MEEEIEFEDWDNFLFLLATETPYDLQQFVVDEGERLNWYDQGLTEYFLDDENCNLDLKTFEVSLRNYAIDQLIDLVEHGYALKKGRVRKIDLFVQDGVERYRRYLKERKCLHDTVQDIQYFELEIRDFKDEEEEALKEMCKTVGAEFLCRGYLHFTYLVKGNLSQIEQIRNRISFIVKIHTREVRYFEGESKPPRRTIVQQEPVSIYVAGGWEFRRRIADINAVLRAQNFKVVSGWVERENGKKTPQDLASDAKFDIEEVREADVLLAIMDDSKYAYRGTFTEIGCALGLKKMIIIVCPGSPEVGEEGTVSYPFYCMTNVFFWHQNIYRVATVEAAVDIIKLMYSV